VPILRQGRDLRLHLSSSPPLLFRLSLPTGDSFEVLASGGAKLRQVELRYGEDGAELSSPSPDDD